jgi:hypothetical protein
VLRDMSAAEHAPSIVQRGVHAAYSAEDAATWIAGMTIGPLV